jgi:hypothetical protein
MANRNSDQTDNRGGNEEKTDAKLWLGHDGTNDASEVPEARHLEGVEGAVVFV